MESLIQQFRSHVIEASQNPTFLHHEWFVKYHLEIFERIALELCDRYPEADRSIVHLLVWLHDYAKILDQAHEHDVRMLEKGREKLLLIGFPEEFVTKIIEYLTLFEKKMEIDLGRAPIEVQIASSADAASHLVGPFWSIYYKENNDKSVEELMESNRKKLIKDWERKMVLPEVREAFEARFNFVNEQAGRFPEKFFNK